MRGMMSSLGFSDGFVLYNGQNTGEKTITQSIDTVKLNFNKRSVVKTILERLRLHVNVGFTFDVTPAFGA